MAKRGKRAAAVGKTGSAGDDPSTSKPGQLDPLSPLFERHGYLSRLLEGAHHRNVIKFGAPALVRMIGLWRPWSKVQPGTTGGGPGASPTEEWAEKREEQRLGEIDLTIAAVYRALNSGSIEGVSPESVHCDARQTTQEGDREVLTSNLKLFGGTVDIHHRAWDRFGKLLRGDTPPHEKFRRLIRLQKVLWKPKKDANPHRSIRIGFTWRQAKCHFLFELHAEFLSILVVLDYSTDLPPNEAPAPARAALKKLCGRQLCWPKDQAGVDQGALTPAMCGEALFEQVWADLEAVVRPTLSANPAALGARFADFRGVVIAPCDTARPGASNAEFRTPEDWERNQAERKALQGLGGRCQVADLERDMADELAPPSLLDFLTHPKPLEKAELTLSALLADPQEGDTPAAAEPASSTWRALFASTMKPPYAGDQSPHALTPERASAGEHLPYLLYADPVNRWQLGRLVYRINRAGLNRVAATMHYDRLNKIGRDLNNVERLLEAGLDKAEGSFAEEREAARKDAKDLAERLVRIFEPRDKEGNIVEQRIIDGPLDYRIERSRSYVSQWTRVTEALRIRRIAGHQPYDEFVNQRLGAAFDFIDRLGRRYARVMQGQADLQRRLAGIEARAVAEGAAEAARQMAELQNETIKTTRSIEKIQEVADVALFAVLIPYYSAYILAAALEGVVSKYYLWYIALVWGLSYGYCWLKSFRCRVAHERDVESHMVAVASAEKGNARALVDLATASATQIRERRGGSEVKNAPQTERSAKDRYDQTAMQLTEKREALERIQKAAETDSRQWPSRHALVPALVALLLTAAIIGADYLVTRRPWPELVLDKKLVEYLEPYPMAETLLACLCVAVPLGMYFLVKSLLPKRHGK